MTPESRAALEARILKHEGHPDLPYFDSRELATAGIGHLIEHIVIPANCITCGDILRYLSDKSVHQAWFDADVDNAIQGAATCLITYYEQPEIVQQVLAELCFQMGTYGLAKFEKMLQACRVRDYPKAAQEGLNSAWWRQTPKRAEELMALLAAA